MQPRRLNPKFVAKDQWGSLRLDPWFANRPDKIGEVWFDASLDGGPPLLVKFLFTSAKLSVQVHPPDDYARIHHHSRGKTEMWHILAAEPGAKIAAGFREPIGPERLRESAISGEIEHLLEWFEARPGDTFFIPAGTVHAIGGGLALCEIQQRSDITYRLYDYGRPRELHLDHAVAVSRREPHKARCPPSDPLIACEYFVTSRFVSPRTHSVSGLELLIVIEGQGAIAGSATQAGDVWLASPGPVELEGVTVLHTREPRS